MTWRLAKSLETLRSEVNQRWPNRSKASDGTVGDAAHASTWSDHNPTRPAGVVCAFDLTHDPDNGVDCHAISEHIRTHRPPALKYIIFNGRICSAKGEWVWRPNRGHEKHMHVSVGVGPDGQSTGPYDDTTPWLVHYEQEEDDMRLEEDDPLVDEMRERIKAMHVGNWVDRNGSGDLQWFQNQMQKALKPVTDRLAAIEAKLK